MYLHMFYSRMIYHILTSTWLENKIKGVKKMVTLAQASKIQYAKIIKYKPALIVIFVLFIL